MQPPTAPATKPRPPELAEAVDRLGDRLLALGRQSVDLARIEARDAARRAGRAAARGAFAVVAAGMAYLLAIVASLRCLERVLPPDGAAALLAGLHLLAAALLTRRRSARGGPEGEAS